MSDIDLILWGIIIISSIGFIGCIISLIQERSLWKLKSKLWLEEYRLRQRAYNLTDYQAFTYDPNSEDEAPCPACHHSSALHEYVEYGIKCNENNCSCWLKFHYENLK
jgi:hypothetical protein